MTRQKFVAGNWKMFTTAESARQLAAGVARGITDDRIHVAVCPPFPYLAVVAETLRGSPVALGAQNCYPAKEGAFTGEVSPVMLLDVGCRYVIVGHSERRHGLDESSEFVNRKLHAALAARCQRDPSAELSVILCVGETLDEREAGQTHQVLAGQLAHSLLGFPAEALNRLTIAYEPVWAIGTGMTATPEQAQEAHAFVRTRLAAQFGAEAAQRLTIQYGGSVKPENVARLLHEPDVGGALVGGASLNPDFFLAIVRAAA
jgi:triosephosphate isomerase